jgi:ceramide glucosyltransferase
VGRYARWISVIRAQRPHLLASYPLLFACTLPLIALSFAAALFEGRAALAVAGAAVALRLAVALLARARSTAAIPLWRLPLDALMADAVLVLAYARALGTTRVRWRNTDLRIVRGGELVVEEVAR